jgi:hypothetical protein
MVVLRLQFNLLFFVTWWLLETSGMKDAKLTCRTSVGSRSLSARLPGGPDASAAADFFQPTRSESRGVGGFENCPATEDAVPHVTDRVSFKHSRADLIAIRRGRVRLESNQREFI